MNVAFIYDPGCLDGTRGGAELAMDELVLAAPDRVTITELRHAETVVIGNCVRVPDDLIERLEGKTVWRYHHDLARDESPRLWEWLNENAEHIFTSPFHRDLYEGHPDSALIPSSLNLTDFRPNRQTRRHPNRKGIVTVGSWQSPGKGGNHVADEIARRGETVDCYGPGPFPPAGPHVAHRGPVDHADLPSTLWGYEEFIFLPSVPEPFGRCVAEAWAAGCAVTTNDLVGAKWWIENEPDRLWTAAEDFWELVA
jgi:glycosyltransferase involved in cell wall biosynthesis